MANFDMPWDIPDAPEEPAKVTPLIGGTPTPEEEAEAFEELFKDLWRNNR